MNAWDRFINTVERKKVDHFPVALIGTNRFFAGFSNLSLSDVLYNPEMMIKTQFKVFHHFPEVTFIPGPWPDYGVAILSALGCRIYWTDDGMPQVRGEIIDNENDLLNYMQPKPKTDGLMPLYLHTLKLFKSPLKNETGQMPFLWSFGPGEIASYLSGITNLFMGMVDNKQLVTDLLEKVTETIVIWLKAQLDINPDAAGFLLTDDISGMVAKKHYEEFILPCHQRIRSEFPELLIVFHNDAKSDHILSSIANTGFEVFNFGKTTDILKCRDAISHKMCLMGNLDPLDLLINGSAEDVYQAAMDSLKLFSAQQGFILSAGGGMNKGVPEENIHALVSAVKDYTPL